VNEEFHIILSQLQRKLGLERYSIDVRFYPDSEMAGDWITVTQPPHTHHAMLAVSEHLLAMPLATQRRCIIHELLHIQLQPIMDVPKFGLEEAGVAPAAGKVILEAMRQQNEVVVDRMARALEPAIR
jgi:hypothetical protein